MHSDQIQRAVTFRDLHLTPFVVPNPWDVGSAKLLAGMGFSALATTSAGAANAAGVADTEAGRDLILANAAQIARAVDVPVAADLENGYDDPAETIRLAGDAGLVGGSIEDYDPETKSIYSVEVAVERLSAAVSAGRSMGFPFTLTARCENHLYGVSDLADTIARLQAYEAAGADVLYAPGLPDLDAIRAVCASVTKPVNILANGVPTAQLFAAGATRISLGSSLYRTAMRAVASAAAEVQASGTFTFVPE